MHAGVALLLHASIAGRDAWELGPGVVLPLILSAALYVRGTAVVVDRARRPIRKKPIVAFAFGWLTLALALVSPLHEASEQLFSAHMVQHELLMAVAAPLLVLARPYSIMLLGLPSRVRVGVAAFGRSKTARRTWATLVGPFDAWLLHALAIWLWHIPLFFQATLTSEPIHALQHLSFFGSGVLFWWSVIHSRQRASQGKAIIYLFTTAVHTSVLGALLCFSHQPWYPQYASGAAEWGLTAMTDQQLAGLIMWIPAGAAYLIAALAVMRRWLADSECAVTRREQAAAAIAP